MSESPKSVDECNGEKRTHRHRSSHHSHSSKSSKSSHSSYKSSCSESEKEKCVSPKGKKHRKKKKECYPCDDDVICLRKFKWHIIKGDKGDEGRKGEKGSRGRPGERGSRGKTGKRAAKGSRGSKGSRGCKGSRGKRGHDGRGGILGYSFATNDLATVFIPSGGSVTFNNTSFPSHGVSTDGTVFTLAKAGVYEFDFMVNGVSSDPTLPLQYALIVNGTNVMFGSTFSSVLGTKPLIVQGTVLAEFPDVTHGITTGDGTTVELKNMLSNTTSTNTTPPSNNAFLKITRIA
jgi:hypothetical protein